jgi:hypothetical protein
LRIPLGHARSVPFGYYRRLSKRDKAIYRESDAQPAIALEDARSLRPIADRIQAALAGDDRITVEKLTQQLVSGVCKRLRVPIAGVRVMAVRPKSARAELYGLYVRAEDERPVIMVWMRTAAKQAPVAHRTYLRTLFHEVCHHLDFEHLGLEESFHTRGFFQRESSLMRQIAPRRAPRARWSEASLGAARDPAPASTAAPEAASPATAPRAQLDLGF